MKPSDHCLHNRSAWDRLAKTQNRLARPARDEDFANPLASVDGPGWLGGDISGQKVLCLAAGGGRQAPIYSAAGADVTVVDISPAMLQLDRAVAAERGLNYRVIEGTMEDLSVFKDAEFDIVIHPVSSCYVPDLRPVFLEVARVTRGGGVYISQHKQPASMQASLVPKNGNYILEHDCYSNRPCPISDNENLIREDGTLEWIHRWEEIIGFMCRSGFVIEDITEPMHAKPDADKGSFGHRSQFVPPYVRIKARRIGRPESLLIR